MIKMKSILLNEAPIDTFQTIGDFSKGSSFTNPVDRKLLTNPVSVQKVKDFFKNTTTDFDLYFVNTKEARKHTEVGEVDEDFIHDELGIKSEQLKGGKIDTNHITVFFTNNKGAERFPMTAWIIAHRFGHVVARKNFSNNRSSYAWDEYRTWVDSKFQEILAAYGLTTAGISAQRGYYWSGNDSGYKKVRQYQLAKRHVAETLGTFKSARDKNLREEFEFQYEWFALYLKTGKTPLNLLPDVMTLGYGAFGRANSYRLKDKESAEQTWIELIRDGHYYMENVLSDCVGKIFVM